MGPIENPQLISAMEDVVKRDGIEARSRLFAALLRAILVVPTPKLPPEWSGPGSHIADGKASFQVIAFNKADGTQFTPVFSDDEALRNWNPSIPSIALRGQDYFSIVTKLPIQQVAINPFDPVRGMIRPGGFVDRWEMESLATGTLPRKT